MEENRTEQRNVMDFVKEREGVTYGKLEKILYYSTTRERETPVNVLFPPHYSENETYPVLYAMHGFWENEDSLARMCEARILLGNLIADGLAKPMIIVFPYIYTSKERVACTKMDPENAICYDNFIFDLSTDLMPWVEEHFPVKTGREDTAITGFSMGGRESLFIAVSKPERFGYVGAACPAPGLTPAMDHIMGIHPGQLAEQELTWPEQWMPKALVLTAGAVDNVVGDNPVNYHRILTEHAIPHEWQLVPDGDHNATSVIPHMVCLLQRLFV